MATAATAIEAPRAETRARAALVRLCAAGFLAYCSYAICRTPLVPLFARELGADVRLVGLIVGASTLTGVVLKLPAGAALARFGGAHQLTRTPVVHDTPE
jgi:MFS family permease